MIARDQIGGGPGAAPALVSRVSSARNSDGGWAYGSGPSWTEPTAYALLALLAAGANPGSVETGIRWLKSTQRADGGWPPAAGVDQSTWVTALAVLALSRAGALPARDRSLAWLLRQEGRDSGWVFRLRSWMMGNRPENRLPDPGWPWFPGTAAWVVPTAMTVLALGALRGKEPSPELEQRLVSGRNFLLSRACRDGGWNHGSSRALGYESDSYPETTGVALLAFPARSSSTLAAALSSASQHLRSCRSHSGASWLQLGLLAHARSSGEVRAAVRADRYPVRALPDAALALLAESAHQGRHIFVE